MCFYPFLRGALLANMIHRVEKSQLSYGIWDWNVDQRLPLMKEKNRWYHHLGHVFVHNSQIRNCFQRMLHVQVDEAINHLNFSKEILKASFNWIIYQKFVKIEVHDSLRFMHWELVKCSWKKWEITILEIKNLF